MTRHHDLDWVRVCAFGLLVLYHVGMYYVSWDWHVKSPQAGPALEPFMLLSSPWRLSLLFLVSGAATSFLLAKTGSATRGFLGARSWRLLVPLVFGMLVIVPPQAYYEVVEQLPGGYHEGYLAFLQKYVGGYAGFCDLDGCLDVPTWNHLWFIAYLWVYTVVLWLLCAAWPRMIERAGAWLARGLSGTGVLVWPIAYLALARMLLVERFPSTHGLFDDVYNHVQYVGVFMLGVLVARQASVWDSIERLRWPALVIWLAGSCALIVFFGYALDLSPPDWARVPMRAVWACVQWCAVVAVLGFARRWAPGDSRALRYLVPAVFPVYILHQTIIVVFAHRLKPFGLPATAEGLLLVVATFGCCFALYEVIRRVRWLRPLFGLGRNAPKQPHASSEDAPAHAGRA